ncbi:MAG: hypothetical protein VB858_06660, partial [Planctomycetaceae bacterium]
TANTMGLPHRISSAPFQRPAHRKVTESDVETPLPTLFPSMVDAGFRLRLRGDTFQIRYSTPTILNDPRGHILARWWINGEAFNPTMIEEPAGQKDVAERVRIGRALDLHVTFNSRQFGAQKGDRIGVQLLFCPDGWISPGRDRHHQLRLYSNSVDSISRMSDKVEFTVP